MQQHAMNTATVRENMVPKRIRNAPIKTGAEMGSICGLLVFVVVVSLRFVPFSYIPT